MVAPADRRIVVRLGLPKVTGSLVHEAPGPILVSAGALWEPEARRFRAPPVPMWWRDVALDSAGFVAMTHHGGYPWTVEQYVELVVRGRGLSLRPDDRDDDMLGLGAPWTWWSAMDYCCEPEIASNRAEVDRRIDLTVSSYVDCLAAANAWREEGVTDLDDPMPILQGRTPDDYARCARDLEAAIDAENPCTCPAGDEDCDAEWHRSTAGLPELVGVGSVCRRPLRGPEGLLAVVGRLDAVLPPRVSLHLFGVKSAALGVLAGHPRIHSVDSQAWGYAARREALDAGASCTVALKVDRMHAWHGRQVRAARPRQVPLL